MTIHVLKKIYFPSEIDIDKELFYPVFKEATDCRCMTGYFSSGALKELASSISYFLKYRIGSIRFIISPNLSEIDSKALKRALDSDNNLLDLLFPGVDLSEDGLRARSVEALCYLGNL